jgi:hypothetical protein
MWLAVLDLTGTDLIECMYGYTEMESLATCTYFDMDSESLLIQWQEFIQILSSSDNRSLTHLNELFQSVDHKDKNLSIYSSNWQTIFYFDLHQKFSITLLIINYSQVTKVFLVDH